jgi:DNA replication protein DnaC
MILAQWIRREFKPSILGYYNIPQHLWGVSLDGIGNFPYREAVREILTNLPKLKSDLEEGKGWLLHGPTRSGKSAIAAMICREVVFHGNRPLWFSAPMLVKRWLSNDDVCNDILKRHLLVVDDLGTEARTDRSDTARAIVCQIIRERLNYARPVIITTNLTLEQLGEERWYGDKFVELLRGYVTPIEVAGMDWNDEKAKRERK